MPHYDVLLFGWVLSWGSGPPLYLPYIYRPCLAGSFFSAQTIVSLYTIEVFSPSLCPLPWPFPHLQKVLAYTVRPWIPRPNTRVKRVMFSPFRKWKPIKASRRSCDTAPVSSPSPTKGTVPTHGKWNVSFPQPRSLSICPRSLSVASSFFLPAHFFQR